MLRWLQDPNTLALQDLAGVTEDTAFSTCLSSPFIPSTEAKVQVMGKF